MSKAASRGSSKVELVATTTTMATTGDDSSPGPLTRSALKNAAAAAGATAGAAASKPSTSSSRFGAEAAAGGSRGSKATAAAAKKESSSMQASRGAAAQKKASRSSPSSSPKYSVLLPTYCEAQNIGIIVSMLVKVFEENSIDFEIIVIDDASPDGTADVVRRLSAAFGPDRVLLRSRPGKLGLGTAYAFGLESARGEFVLLMDADLSHHPRHIPQMLEAQRQTGADVVSGTRYASGGGVCGWGTRRKVISRGANTLATLLLLPPDFAGAARSLASSVVDALGLKRKEEETRGSGSEAAAPAAAHYEPVSSLSDLTGSFRLYRADLLRKLIPRVKSKGYAFQMEVAVRAAREPGAVLAEVPIVFVDRLFGSSKLGGAEITLFVRGLLKLFFTT